MATLSLTHPILYKYACFSLFSHPFVGARWRKFATNGASFPTKPEYANPGGAVMGGIVASFLDDCMGPLVVAATGGEKFPVTLDLHTTYFKPVPIGPRAVVEAKIDRMGGSAVFTSASIIGKNGEVLVRAIQTAMLRSAGHKT